jgi:hypothetical protein
MGIMGRGNWNDIWIDKDPNDPYKGWGWVDVKTEDIQKYGISCEYPDSYYRLAKTLTHEQRRTVPNSGKISSRGKAGGKRFTLNINGDVVEIRAQKSLSIHAISTWVKSWASPDAKLITPGNRTHSLDGKKLANQAHFVYFILNEDSNAIKIGRAKDLVKRMNTLQTSSPAKLKLVKSLQVEGSKEAHELEGSLHRKFDEFRLAGEWFRAEAALWDYINQL